MNITLKQMSIFLLLWALTATCQDKCVVKPDAKPRVRVNATTAEGKKQLDLYAKGVKAMQGRAATDPTSWSYQAAMHGTYTTPVQPLWNTCQHGTYFFLSWHRMYIYFFEQLVRGASDPAFNLPYWDYDNPTSSTDPRLQLPAEFRNTSSPLYVSERNPSMNAGGYLPAGDVETNYSMSRMMFTCGATNWASSFGGKQVPSPIHFSSGFGALESLPHNAVHDDVGGWMSDPNTAAQDPIFWLHHANIDRLWDAWEKLDSGRTNNWDATWLDQKFYFFNEKKQQCYLTAKDILDDAKQLGYTYENEKVPVPPTKVACPPKKVTAITPRLLAELPPEKRTTLGAAPINVDIPVKETGLTPKKLTAAASPQRLVLTLDDIQFEKNPAVGYEIYLNLPKGEQPNYKSPYYAGTVHFFGLKHSREENHDAQLQFDVTDVVARLQKLGQWKDHVTVTYVPRGPTEPGKVAAAAEVKVAGTATIGRISLSEAD